MNLTRSTCRVGASSKHARAVDAVRPTVSARTIRPAAAPSTSSPVDVAAWTPCPHAQHARASTRCAAGPSHGSAPHAGGKVGVVIVDHGSRKKESNEMLFEFAKLYQQTTGAQIVEAAHMEIAEPTIEQAIGKCAAQGVDTVVIAPYFLSKGRHIQEDIPALVKEAQAKYAGLKCIIAQPIGIDPLMAQLISNRVSSAVAAQPGV